MDTGRTAKWNRETWGCKRMKRVFGAEESEGMVEIEKEE